MKITPKELSGPGEVRKVRREDNRSASFQDVLKSTLEKSGGATDPAGAKSTAPIPGTPLIQITPVEVSGTPAVKEIESLVELLEEYQQRMEDPALTLKDVYPLVRRMEGENERLRPVLESMPEGSAAKDILNRALVASTVEVIKFNRGDYN